MTKKKITIITLALTILLGIICILILPNEVSVQWDSSGAVQNTMSKYVAMLICLGSSLLCLMWAQTKENKWFCLLGGSGFVLEIVIIVMNLL